MRGNWVISSALAALLLTAAAVSAVAVEDVYVSNGFHVDLGAEFGAGAFASPDSNFGLGRIDLVSGVNTGDAEWLEGYFKPSLVLRYEADTGTTLSAHVSGVLAATGGDGDVGGFTSGGTDIDLDQAYAELSTKLMGGKEGGGWDVTVSGGRQKVEIGDGFLISDGNLDIGKDRTYWLAPRQSFDLAATVKLQGEALGTTGFIVKSDKDTARTEMFGSDTTYSGDWGSLGLLTAYIFDGDGTIQRKGMDVVSIRAKDIKAPGIDNLTFSGEAAYEFGGNGGTNYDAYGFYGNVSYEFADLAWAPTLTYRYARFSGDSNPGNGSVRSFDPLFYGYSDWGSWFMGEVVGQYMLFNSNQTTHMVKLSVAPTESVGAGLIYYHFELDKKNYFGTPVSGRDFADEVNAYADWEVNDNLNLSGVAGFAIPDTAAKQIFGNKTNWIFEVTATYSY
jgi:hypothetical protein